MYNPTTIPALTSDTLIVNGEVKHPACYNCFNDKEQLMEVLGKHEGDLHTITLYSETYCPVIERIVQYFLLRARLGCKYPIKQINILNTTDETQELVVQPLRTAGYNVATTTN